MSKKVKCKEMVKGDGPYASFHMHRCSYWATKDGYCGIHHPDAREERLKKSQKRYEEGRRQSPTYKLGLALNRIKELEAEVKELIKEGARQAKEIIYLRG